NLGMFTVTKIAMEKTGAVAPAHPVPRTPGMAYPGLQRCRGPSAPLTRLARLTAGQSLGTGHVHASLKPHHSRLHRPGPPERTIADLGQTARALASVPTGRTEYKHGSTRKRTISVDARA